MDFVRYHRLPISRSAKDVHSADDDCCYYLQFQSRRSRRVHCGKPCCPQYSCKATQQSRNRKRAEDEQTAAYTNQACSIGIAADGV